MSRRDPWLDNAKMTLVTLVVLGHFWALLPETALHRQLYDFLYAWHIPAFVLVTGYLSRSFTWTRKRLLDLVTTILVPYVIFESLMALFRIRFGDEQLEGIFADPHWPLWYLAALFIWRLATPVLRAMPAAVPVSIAVSVVAGAYAGDTLDLARVLGLLPFFVLGLKATPEQLTLLRTRTARVAGAVVLAGVLVAARFTDRWIDTEWLYYRARYDELASSDARSMLVRLALIVLGTLAALAFLALVPRVGGWFTRMGVWTLGVYLFHGFVVKTVDYVDYDDWAASRAELSLVVTTALALGLSLLLAWRPLARRLHYLVDPYGHLLLRHRSGRAVPTR